MTLDGLAKCCIHYLYKKLDLPKLEWRHDNPGNMEFSEEDEHEPGGRRVVETIWNVGAGDPSLHPVRNANSGNPLKVD